MPRIHAELREQNVCVARNQIAQLMRNAGLCGISRRRGTVTIKGRSKALPAPDLLRREFTAEHPDELYVADITYVPTLAGFLFLAVVVDARTRRMVGWSMAHPLRTQLVVDVLNMALHRRRPAAVIRHSDQGSQYIPLGCGHRCKEAEVRPSMRSVGEYCDNAPCESFVATLECELIDRRLFAHAPKRN